MHFFNSFYELIAWGILKFLFVWQQNCFQFFFKNFLTRTEDESDSDGNSKSNSYSANETYLNLDTILVSKQTSNSYFEQNEYNFPFNFVLPKYLPYSFHHSIGQIKYFLTGIIDIPSYVF